jgi:hypothetical protein
MEIELLSQAEASPEYRRLVIGLAEEALEKKKFIIYIYIYIFSMKILTFNIDFINLCLHLTLIY